MHLVIYFCGTGGKGKDYLDFKYLEKNVCKIKVKGCSAPEVCNSATFPDLHSFAERFTRQLFGSSEFAIKKTLAPMDSHDLFSIGIEEIQDAAIPDLKVCQGMQISDDFYEHRKEKLDEKIQNKITEIVEPRIESITLCGYSRGAVECFEVAKVLNEIAPEIPVDIVANQPVPGNFYSGMGTNAASVADCSHLNNLKNVTVILGAYTGEQQPRVDLHVKSELPTDLTKYENSYILLNPGLQIYFVANSNTEKLNFKINKRDFNEILSTYTNNTEGTHSIPVSAINNITGHYSKESYYAYNSSLERGIHRGFFSQIVPMLPTSARRDLIVIPCENHHDFPLNTPHGNEHMHMQIARYLFSRGAVSETNVNKRTVIAKETYTLHKDVQTKLFPRITKLQSIFGLDANEAYRYLDKLHPRKMLREGCTWNPVISLIDWWNEQEKNASWFSSQLTKDLLATIRETDSNDTDSLKKLFQQADQWLLLKENTPTSRYYQVESLRNNIFNYLVNDLNVPAQELYLLNRETMQETGYFHKHWLEGSKAASWFESEETLTLKQAFVTHAECPPSEENDKELLNALRTWLDQKSKSQSKRYGLVVEMTEHLQGVINNCYHPDSKIEHQNNPNPIQMTI